MTVRDLRLRWSSDNGEATVAFVGDIDLSSEAVMHAVEEVATSTPGLAVDLSRVTFIDVAGLRLLDRLASLPTIDVRSSSPSIMSVAAKIGRSTNFAG